MCLLQLRYVSSLSDVPTKKKSVRQWGQWRGVAATNRLAVLTQGSIKQSNNLVQTINAHGNGQLIVTQWLYLSINLELKVVSTTQKIFSQFTG
jgi:hypothetical protein